MELDAFDLFGKSHRIYLYGVRTAIRDLLESHYGEQWWEQGILPSFWGQPREQIAAEGEKNEAGERHLLLENRHFGYIVRKNHEAVFARSFPNSLRAFRQFGQLTTVRNDWAHVQQISPGRYRQAADIMQDILAALNRQEALEIERMTKDAMADSMTEITREPIEEATDPENEPEIVMQPPTEPVESWRRLQSYLQVERDVTIAEDNRVRNAHISVKVTNIAPESPDWPSVVFRNVSVIGAGVGEQGINDLRPGETAEANFDMPEARLLSFELSVSAEIDGQELLRFRQPADLPADAAAPIKQRFCRRIREIRRQGFRHRSC